MRPVAKMVALGAVLVLLSGCQGNAHRMGLPDQHEYQDDSQLTQHVTSVRVSGEIALKLHVGGTAAVHRTLRFSDTGPRLDTWHVEGGVLELDDCHGYNCAVLYDVTVPTGTTLTGEVDSGAVDATGPATADLVAKSSEVTVQDVPGAVNLRSSSGPVHLSDLGGAATITAASGDVDADDVRGALTVHASSAKVTANGVGGALVLDLHSGEATIGMATPQDVSADVESGSVDLTVPQANYRVVTGSESGEVTSSVPNDATGTHLLQLHAKSGVVTARYL